MGLTELYEAYRRANEAYLDFAGQLTASDFSMLVPEVIKFELRRGKEQFMALMEKVNALPESETEKENIKDLKYLLMDSLFLANDLAYFYESNELGRFKLRVLNAVNKRRRAAMFNEGPAFGGSCIEGKI